MYKHQRDLIENERSIEHNLSQRGLARQLKLHYCVSLSNVPYATVYNHIRRFDKRNAATKTAGLEAVTATA